jgi:hypothetical protein
MGGGASKIAHTHGGAAGTTAANGSGNHNTVSL